MKSSTDTSVNKMWNVKNATQNELFFWAKNASKKEFKKNVTGGGRRGERDGLGSGMPAAGCGGGAGVLRQEWALH